MRRAQPTRPRTTARSRSAEDAKQRVDAAQLTGLVRTFSGRKIAVLADLVADEFVYGDIERVSREAPVLILRHRKTLVVPGGGGNAVANLRAFGAEPLPVGIIGDDASGRLLLDAFEDAGVTTSSILVRKGMQTPTKSRVLAGGIHTRRQQIVRIDRGGVATPTPRGVERDLDRALSAAVRRTEGLLVADYGLGVATPERVERVRPRLEQGSRMLFVDSRGRIAHYGGASACTPNQEELERCLDVGPLEDEAELSHAARRLLKRTGNHAVLVTRGARGMSLFERGRPGVHVPAFGSDEVADVTGAGDTVIATFALARIAGAGGVDSTRLANYAAGLVVMKAGTATIDQEELCGAIEEDAAS